MECIGSSGSMMRTHVDLEGRPDDRVEIDSEAYGRFECSIAELCARQFRTAADYTWPGGCLPPGLVRVAVLR